MSITTPSRLTLVFVALAACATPAARPSGTPLGPAAVRELGGGTFDAGERYRGRVLVLDFWASWCAACKRSVPRLVRLAAAYPAERVTVLGVNAGESSNTARTGAASFGITYPIALDPDLVLTDALGAGSLPVLVIVDQDGTIVHRARELDAESLAVIRRLTGE